MILVKFIFSIFVALEIHTVFHKHNEYINVYQDIR